MSGGDELRGWAAGTTSGRINSKTRVRDDARASGRPLRLDTFLFVKRGKANLFKASRPQSTPVAQHRKVPPPLLDSATTKSSEEQSKLVYNKHEIVACFWGLAYQHAR